MWSRYFGWEDSATVSTKPTESQTLHVKKTRQTQAFLEQHAGPGKNNDRSTSGSTVPFGQVHAPSGQPPGASDSSMFISQGRPAGGLGNLFPGSIGKKPDSFATTHHGIDVSDDPPQQRPPDFVEQSNKDACVLCPHVSVATEVTALLEGQRSLWAAIEVSGRLSKLPARRALGNHTGITTGSFIKHELGEAHWPVDRKRITEVDIIDRFFEFGCLYDLSIEILPCQGSSIVQVMGEHIFPT